MGLLRPFRPAPGRPRFRHGRALCRRALGIACPRMPEASSSIWETCLWVITKVCSLALPNKADAACPPAPLASSPWARVSNSRSREWWRLFARKKQGWCPAGWPPARRGADVDGPFHEPIRSAAVRARKTAVFFESKRAGAECLSYCREIGTLGAMALS